MNEAQRQHDQESIFGGKSHAVWIESLGKVAFWFGQLEWCSYWVIESFGLEGLTPRVAGQGFSVRTGTAKSTMAAHLAGRNLEDLAQQWVSFFDAILAAAHRRNAVLHSPLVIKVDRTPDGSLLKALSLAHMRDRETVPYVELDEVRELALELERLAIRMTDLVQSTGMFAPAMD